MTGAILERTFGFEPSSETTAPKVFEARKSTELQSFHLDLPLDDINADCQQFGFLTTDSHLTSCAGFVETVNAGFYFLLFLS